MTILGSIVSVQQIFKRFSEIPEKGLIIFCGNIITEEGKEKKVGKFKKGNERKAERRSKGVCCAFFL
jgi:peptide subunit release factor 1 (eRF1)